VLAQLEGQTRAEAEINPRKDKPPMTDLPLQRAPARGRNSANMNSFSLNRLKPANEPSRKRTRSLL
jgi:hypothetical protein